MKKIAYKREIPALIEQTADGEQIVVREAYLQIESLYFTDATKDAQIQEVLKYAHNGEYTIEDDGQPEPEPSESEQLRSDVNELQEALDMILSGVTE